METFCTFLQQQFYINSFLTPTPYLFILKILLCLTSWLVYPLNSIIVAFPEVPTPLIYALTSHLSCALDSSPILSSKYPPNIDHNSYPTVAPVQISSMNLTHSYPTISLKYHTTTAVTYSMNIDLTYSTNFSPASSPTISLTSYRSSIMYSECIPYHFMLLPKTTIIIKTIYP